VRWAICSQLALIGNLLHFYHPPATAPSDTGYAVPVTTSVGPRFLCSSMLSGFMPQHYRGFSVGVTLLSGEAAGHGAEVLSPSCRNLSKQRSPGGPAFLHAPALHSRAHTASRATYARRARAPSTDACRPYCARDPYRRPANCFRAEDGTLSCRTQALIPAGTPIILVRRSITY
jgi:hypothetical protein